MFKRILSAALCLVMLCAMTACGDADPAPTTQDTTPTTADSATTTTAAPVDEPVTAPVTVDKLEADDLQYVMIYNPRVFNPRTNFDSSSRMTGDFGSQINTDLNRSEELETEEAFVIPTPLTEFPENISDLELNRADVLAFPYSVGDKRMLYYSTTTDTNGPRAEAEFTCEYAGEYCYIWTYNAGVDAAKIEEYGKNFDETVYEKMSETFGDPRFDDKINFLLYPLGYYPGTGGIIMGYFHLYDLFQSSEIAALSLDSFGPNVNGNFIHINANAVNSPKFESIVVSTLAHEYQHLLIASATLESGTANLMAKWLNEAMSTYTEELLFPGIKSNYYLSALHDSDMVRNGQSLYNFIYNTEDGGVYDQVYILAEYIVDLMGDDVFSNVHSYWRNVSFTDTEQDALINNISDAAYDKIDRTISYPSSLTFNDENEEWVSKMVLDFYVSQLSKRPGSTEEFRLLINDCLLYDSISAANIEGGGRIILAVNDNTFEIPEDADENMVYVGFDSNYNVVTDYIIK